MPEPRTDLLRALPQVEELMQAAPMKALETIVPRSMLVDRARAAVDGQRQLILAEAVDAVDVEAILPDAVNGALATLRPRLRRVINATGVVIHTNLGRSVLAEPAVPAVVEAARGYSTLEYSIVNMARGSRHDHVEHLICALTGAEAAIASLAVFADICTANNTVAIISVGTISRNIAHRFGIPPRRAASLLDTFSCFVQGIIPYGAQLLMAAGLASVSPVQIIPYLYYPFIMGCCAVLAIILQRPRYRD